MILDEYIVRVEDVLVSFVKRAIDLVESFGVESVWVCLEEKVEKDFFI